MMLALLLLCTLSETSIAKPPPPSCDVTAFGATPDDDSADDHEAFTQALATCVGRTVTVPAGKYRLDSTVNIGQLQLSPGRNRTCDGTICPWCHCNDTNPSTQLHLNHGAALRRLAAHSAAITPVVRVAQFGCMLTGDQGRVESENASPRGVVNLGPATMPPVTPVEKDIGGPHGAIQFAHVTGIFIVGQYRCTHLTNPGTGSCITARNFSRTILPPPGGTEEPNPPWTNTSDYEQCGMFPGQTASFGRDGSVGLCLDSAEPLDMGQSVTYQNTIKDMVIVGCDIGVYSAKWTNANHFANLAFISNGAASMWFDDVDESQLVGTFTGGEFPGNPWPTGSENGIAKMGKGVETFQQVLRVTSGGQNGFYAVAAEPGGGQMFYFGNGTVQNTVIGSGECDLPFTSTNTSFVQHNNDWGLLVKCPRQLPK
jgi:hypothetical protein